MWTLKHLMEVASSHQTCINGKWVPGRPLHYWSWSRFRSAWRVLIGRAEAFEWPEGQ